MKRLSNLPPGCSVRDLPGADARDPTKLEEQAQESLEFLYDAGFATPETRQEHVDRVAKIVAKLTDELDALTATTDDKLSYLRAGLDEIKNQPPSVGATYIRQLAEEILGGTWQPDDQAFS